ncbi:MAG: NTP transferase domain-containing protein [Limisphaerales bacterium]
MNAAILVAAGKGVRMGADKLWLEIAGRPVIAHTWQRFNDAKCIGEIILVVRDGMQNHFSELAAKFHFRNPFASLSVERNDRIPFATG